MKKCSRCKEIKKVENFSLLKVAKDGYQYRCKACQASVVKGKYKQKQKEYKLKNLEKIKENAKEYREENKDKIKQQLKEIYQKTKKTRNKKVKEYLNTNPKAKLIHNVRCRTKQAIKGIGTLKLVGTTKEELIKHLESQFKIGMTWENYGKWHIDHRIPLASAKTEEEVIKLCHYSNLQPLWAHENLSKGAKLPVDMAP